MPLLKPGPQQEKSTDITPDREFYLFVAAITLIALLGLWGLKWLADDPSIYQGIVTDLRKGFKAKPPPSEQKK
ncbi:MAG: hypothetical protein EPO02_05720 [Nitrospirae bacterium]|nr:MAG: hypothetical protein EPO02_05720 [Nitrospirota bacterium]